MAFTTIDPTTALIVIDLQRGIVDLPLAHPGGEVVDNSVRLVRAFRSRDLPVVLVNVAGSPPGAPTRATAPPAASSRRTGPS